MRRRGVFLNDRLRISLTDNCNFRCNYCSNEGQNHNNNSFIDVNFLRVLFDKIISEGLYLKKINLTGGEPLLHKDLIQIAFMAHDICENVTVNTNGSLLDKNKVDELVDAGVNCIKFGVDSPFLSYSKPTTNNMKISSNDLREIIIYTKEKIPRSSLNIVVTSFNISHLSDIFDWIIDNKINMVEFIELIDFDFNKHIPTQTEKPSVFFEQISKLKNDYFEEIEYNENLAKYIAYHKSGLILQFAEDFCKHKVCGNLWTRIDAKGCFSPCIKSLDNYTIDLEKSITEQLLEQNKLYCNSMTGHIPRDGDGKLLYEKYEYKWNRGDYLTNKFTQLDL